VRGKRRTSFSSSLTRSSLSDSPLPTARPSLAPSPSFLTARAPSPACACARPSSSSSLTRPSSSSTLRLLSPSSASSTATRSLASRAAAAAEPGGATGRVRPDVVEVEVELPGAARRTALDPDAEDGAPLMPVRVDEGPPASDDAERVLAALPGRTSGARPAAVAVEPAAPSGRRTGAAPAAEEDGGALAVLTMPPAGRAVDEASDERRRAEPGAAPAVVEGALVVLALDAEGRRTPAAPVEGAVDDESGRRAVVPVDEAAAPPASGARRAPEAAPVTEGRPVAVEPAVVVVAVLGRVRGLRDEARGLRVAVVVVVAGLVPGGASLRTGAAAGAGAAGAARAGSS